MSLAARLGQSAVLLVLAVVCAWGIVRRIARRRDRAVDRFRAAQEP